jgi:protein involved in plasmid replication-relaxation
MSQLARPVPSGSQPSAVHTSDEGLRHVAERLDRRVEGHLQGAPQGAPSDGAPQPPAPNTNLVLSVPEPLPPIRKSEVGEGWSGSGPESEKETGQAVGDEKGTEPGRKKGEDDAKKGEGVDYLASRAEVTAGDAKRGRGVGDLGSRAGVRRGKSKGVGSPISTRGGVLTVRDVEVVRWVGRHGVAATEQIAERFWPAECAQRTVRRRLSILREAGLLRASRPGWRRQSKLWLVTAKGLRSAEVALRPARLVAWRVSHDLALVDLSEQLLSEIAGSTWLTERELMMGGWRTSLKLRRLPDGLLIRPDGRRYAVELEASRKDAERLRRIVNEYLPSLAGPNALAGVIWYARPELGAAVEHLRAAVKALGLSWAFEVRCWKGGRDGR